MAAVEIARTQRDQSFISYRAAILNALEEVENALIALGKDRITAGKMEDAAKSLRQSP